VTASRSAIGAAHAAYSRSKRGCRLLREYAACAAPTALARRPPARRQIWLRLAQDVENRPSVLGRQVRGVGPRIPAGPQVPQAAENVLLHRRRQAVERRGVDEVAARIREQALLQVEVAQRALLSIARAALGELLCEAARAAHRLRQFRLAAEEHVL